MFSRHLVFVHGWALNSGVWNEFIRLINRAYPEITTQCIDLPGYGAAADVECAPSIELMAQYCLDQVEQPSVWVGWSLGGMVAMQAASMKPQAFEAMQLICTSPKFVASDDWPEGVDLHSWPIIISELLTCSC